MAQNKYVILCETSGEEMEQWYYFIKKDGNEKALKYLNDQLEKVEMFILDDLSTFELDLDNEVSATTAKELTMVDINSFQYHLMSISMELLAGVSRGTKTERMPCL